MKKYIAIVFQIVTVLIGICALIFLLVEPHFEGRNTDATFFEVYFKDSFLAYAYIGSISFFIGLYQTFKVLGYVKMSTTFSQPTLKALRTIQHCGVILASWIAAAVAYLFIVRPEDDIAGGVFIGVLITLASIGVALVARKFKQIVKKSI